MSAPVRVTLPDGSTVERVFDAANRLLEETDPRGAATLYTYDAAGRLTRITDALGNARSFVYDAGNFLRALPAERVVYFHVAGHYDEADGECGTGL